MEFEYDETKSRANLAKHGIDFAAVQVLWDDPRFVEVPARTEGEPRSLVLGEINGKMWSAVVTERGGRIRIISARRSRPQEVRIYEG
jgi:uncharacterized DUF497 family protein